MQINISTFLVCTIFGLLPGIAIGFFLGTFNQVNNIMKLLQEFKAEGKEGKWLK